MIRLLKKQYRKIKQKRLFKELIGYTRLSTDSIYMDGFNVELRHPGADHIYLEIGHNSVVNGNFIFETESGHIAIGERSYVGGGCFISRSDIQIGNDVIIAWGGLFYDHDSHSVDWEERKNDVVTVYSDLMKCGDPIANKDWRHVSSAPIIIQDKVWIGAECKILKGVTIGEGAVVGAGSVVANNVDPWTVVAGNPARVIRTIDKRGTP